MINYILYLQFHYSLNFLCLFANIFAIISTFDSFLFCYICRLHIHIFVPEIIESLKRKKKNLNFHKKFHVEINANRFQSLSQITGLLVFEVL